MEQTGNKPVETKKARRFQKETEKTGLKPIYLIALAGVMVIIVTTVLIVSAFKPGPEKSEALDTFSSSPDTKEVPVSNPDLKPAVRNENTVASATKQDAVLTDSAQPEQEKAVIDKPAAPRTEISIPVSRLAGGEAQFFSYTVASGKEVRFFALQSSDNVIRAAFDTCDVCYAAKKGYRQEGDFMVCNNCGQRFASTRINEVKGGCNPAPLQRTVIDDKLVLQIADIESGAWYF